MDGHVDVDGSLPPVGVPAPVLNDLYAHARETLPEECCGLVVGNDLERFARVIRCRNEMTKRHQDDPQQYPRDGRAAFWMNEADYHRAREEATGLGQRVTAVYHSHVGVGAYLSEEDLAYAEHGLFPFPDADQIVVAVLERERKVDGVGLFQREGIGKPFLGRLVEPAAR